MIQAFGLTSNPRKAHPPALDDVSFEARAGHVTALQGATGAGKTTALRLMLELQPGRGITYFKGRPLHRIAHPAQEVGVLLGDVPGHPSRSVRGHLRMLCAASGVPARRADEVLEAVGLVSLREERLGTLSRGMDRRLGLAAALLPDPHTLVLDDPTEGLSAREAQWVHSMLRAHADQGGTVLFTTADSKEAARTADRVVTLDAGRLVADQEAKEFARTRLRPRVAVRSPHAARLAALLTKEARTARRSVEVVREGGNRLSVYGSTTADIGETAFRHGILVHQLADEVGDMGPRADAASGASPAEQGHAAGEEAQAEREMAAPVRAEPESDDANPGAPTADTEGAAPDLPAEEPDTATPGLPAAQSDDAEVDSGAPERDAPAVGLSAEERERAASEPQDATATGRSSEERDHVTVTASVPEAERALSGLSTLAEPQRVFGFSAPERTQAGGGERTVLRDGSDHLPESERMETVQTASSTTVISEADDAQHGAVAPADEDVPGSGRRALSGGAVSADALATADRGRSADATATAHAGRATVSTVSDSTVSESHDRGTATPSAGIPASRTRLPGARNPGAGLAPARRTVRPDTARTLEALTPLPPPISVRPAPSPLRPLRYEIRRAAGVGAGFLTCGAVLAVSAITAVLLARIGHTPQARLFAAWPRELPLPPAALAAGLLGALAFGDEFRHPALAADRGTVPRRLGLLTAKLLVSGATAMLLAFLTMGCDAEVLYIFYGRELTQVPPDWLPLAASWFGLVVGCAWAGVLAAGVFRSTTAGLAAVLAVPVLVVPLAHMVLQGSGVRMAAGLSERMRELLLLQWPFGGERYLVGGVRILAQPYGGALALSLAALLCAYLLTALRSRLR
ncbi:ATP-binding cassette domain-containing protein [Streptomyces sp. NPDC051133]|uniref:ATP-binding cassette domain-containing protein n=1 Tax=Streptomyces sp. NPDC051133 TaxID=3155521 RepID=UPI0034485625